MSKKIVFLQAQIFKQNNNNKITEKEEKCHEFAKLQEKKRL